MKIFYNKNQQSLDVGIREKGINYNNFKEHTDVQHKNKY